MMMTIMMVMMMVVMVMMMKAMMMRSAQKSGLIKWVKIKHRRNNLNQNINFWAAEINI